MNVPRRGEIAEVVGRLSSGRTSLVRAWMRDVTARGGAVAIVDVDDTFDPHSAACAGVDLRRVLWVRCTSRRAIALAATDALVRCPGFELIVLDTAEIAPRLALAATFRWRLAVRRAQTRLVILAPRRLVGAAASCAIETVREAIEWTGPGRRPTRLAGVCTRLQWLRSQPAAHGGASAASMRWSA